VAGRDITEGRASRAVAVDVGVLTDTSVWVNTDIAYDVALGGQPFIYAITDGRPYIRQTAPFRKEQFDNQTEPGEQSLTGWWIRSQSSFHNGAGITFFDPALVSNEGAYRFADSRNVDVWTEGQATLLNAVSQEHVVTGAINTNGRKNQKMSSIKWGTTEGVLLKDEYDVDKIDTAGTVTHFIDYNANGDYPVYAICDDGTTAYWVTRILDSGVDKTQLYSKPLTGTSATTATPMFNSSSIVVSNAVMEFVKERIVMCVNNKVFEFATNATSLPTAVYTHPSTSHVYTSIAASGAAIYVAGYNGIQSTILKFTLSSAGLMPTLTQAVVAAEMPVGEIVHKIHYYLGYMVIGTNKGLRVATVSDVDGSINYGPLILETDQPVYDFCSRDHYVWATTGVDGYPGLTRIDLSQQLEPLVFAYANDIYYGDSLGHQTTSCAFANGTDQLLFCSTANTVGGTITNKQLTSNVATLTTASAHGLVVGDSVWVQGVDSTFNSSTSTYTITAATTTTFSYTKAATNVASTAVTSSTAIVNVPGHVYLESATEKAASGYLTTGYIRYNTLEPKNFKRLIGRGDFTYGSMTLETVDADGTEYDIISYDATVSPVEVTTTQPFNAQEYLAYKFIMYRDATDNTKGPTFKGYQIKATIATPRQRVIRFPVYCFDVETDRYNVLVGYEGRAFDRLSTLETIEENGDVVTWQDLTTGESRQCVIEQISFTRLTPPDRGFSGYGGVIDITIRTV
jgi:hypothetical protein